jgi:hypothetical protein
MIKMAKRFTSDGSLIRLFDFPIVDRPSSKDAVKRANEANEKFASVEDSALCVKFGVPFTMYQKWDKNSS